MAAAAKKPEKPAEDGAAEATAKPKGDFAGRFGAWWNGRDYVAPVPGEEPMAEAKAPAKEKPATKPAEQPVAPAPEPTPEPAPEPVAARSTPELEPAAKRASGKQDRAAQRPAYSEADAQARW